MMTALLLLVATQAADVPPAKAENPPFAVTALTRDQLWNLRLELEATKPSVAAPVMLMTMGGLLTGAGVATAMICGLAHCGSTYSYSSQGIYSENNAATTVIVTIGSVAAAAGVALFVWGTLKLVDQLGLRRVHSLKLDAVEEQLELLRSREQTAPRPL